MSDDLHPDAPTPDEGDDLIRQAIRNYAYAESTPVDLDSVRRRRDSERRRQWIARLAAAAVVLLIVGAVAAWIAVARPTSVPPIEPTPSPTAEPDPTPSADPTPSSSSADPGFPEQTRESNGLPSGGLGDIIEGLQLTAITIADAECPDATTCPGAADLTVTNTTGAPINAFIYFNVYRNNLPAVANAQEVSLAPGESATVTIDNQPMLADSAPIGRTGSIYSWNFSVELS